MLPPAPRLQDVVLSSNDAARIEDIRISSALESGTNESVADEQSY